MASHCGKALQENMTHNTTHPSLATLQKGARHFGCIPVERKRKWWVPQRATEVTADQRDCQQPQGRVGWSQRVWTPIPIKKIKKSVAVVGGIGGRDGWVGGGGLGRVGVQGSGWWWVPDWGTSGDFWGGRAMHHVSCYQPLFPHLIVKPWIMHGGWDWRRGNDGGVGGRDLNLKGALPQWESLPMNNHTDEPWRERERDGRKREGERWGMNWGEKQTWYKKRKKDAHETRLRKHFKHAAYWVFFLSSVFIIL